MGDGCRFQPFIFQGVFSKSPTPQVINQPLKSVKQLWGPQKKPTNKNNKKKGSNTPLLVLGLCNRWVLGNKKKHGQSTWSLSVPWKMVVGRLLSYWESNFSVAMLKFRGVHGNLWRIYFYLGGIASCGGTSVADMSTNPCTLNVRCFKRLVMSPCCKTEFDGWRQCRMKP